LSRRLFPAPASCIPHPLTHSLTWRGRNRTFDLRLIRTPLSPLSYAPNQPSTVASGDRAQGGSCGHWVGGIRTHTYLIKSQECSRYTTTQKWFVRIRLHRNSVDMDVLRLVRRFNFIFSGSPENRTQHNGLIRTIRTTSPRLPRRIRMPGCRRSTVSISTEARERTHVADSRQRFADSH
jgi:hypothetical protein